jgi:hypothetical protein
MFMVSAAMFTGIARMFGNIAPLRTPNTPVCIHIEASFPAIATETAGLTAKR